MRILLSLRGRAIAAALFLRSAWARSAFIGICCGRFARAGAAGFTTKTAGASTVGRRSSSRINLKKSNPKTAKRTRIAARINNHVGNANPLLDAGPIFEALSTLDIGTMIRVVLPVVEGALDCARLLGEAD